MKNAVFAAIAFILLGCSQTEQTAPPPTANSAPKPKPMRVGLLTPGSISDGGWNAIAYEGLQRIQKELGAEIAYQEAKTPAEFEEGFQSFGQRGFDLAFGHGFEF